MLLVIQSILIIVGFTMLVKGADWFVEGAAGIAEKFGIPQLVIGLTIVAMGTSAPEAAVSITAAIKGNADITIGNIVGSNILNILIILGIASAIVSIKVAKSTIRYEIPFMLVITVLLMFLGYTGNKINFIEGIVLWMAFLVYMAYLVVMSKKQKEEIKEDIKEKPVWKLVLGLIIGLVMIIWGSDITVNAATKIADFIGISDRIIGLTIVAFGTSLPELVTSVSAARKGKADIAIGNIVGSNIFNILFVVGTTALITPVAFVSSFLVDTVIAILSGVLLLIFVIRKKCLQRTAGIFMVVCYIVYLVYSLV